MDWLSFFGGALLGAFVGAAGHYFGAKYTDQRRAKDTNAAARRRFEKVRSELPALIAEMSSDVKDPAMRHVRNVFVIEESLTPAPKLLYTTVKTTRTYMVSSRF